MRHERISISGKRRALVSVAQTEKWLLAAIWVATLFFVAATPPFQSPDENQHYMKALLLSEGRLLTEQRDEKIGEELPRAAVELHDVDFPTDAASATRRRFDGSMLARAWRADAERPGTTFADFPNVANYAPTLYAPGAAGLMVGDALGMPRLGSFYAGRSVNALAGLLLLGLALRLMPLGRNALLAAALLPTFSYQAGSLSPDAVINGLGFAGMALALRIGFAGHSKLLAGGLLVIAPLLALAKGVYLPLVAAGLRWPGALRDRRAWLAVGAMAVGAVAFVGWMKMSGGSPALYHIVSRKTGENVMTAPISAQLGVLLADPTAFIRILCESVAERMPVYALQLVGRFGWNAILLPLAAYALAALMLIAALLSGSGMRVGVAQRLWWLAVAAGGALLIETAMYLTATPLGADYIQGTQGRYFLPLLPLAMLALMPAKGLSSASKLLMIGGPLLLLIAMASAADSFWVHGFVTADGMPPHDSVIRALLLPSPRW